VRCHTCKMHNVPINCQGMTRGLPEKRPPSKNILQKTERESWPNKKDIVQRMLRLSKPVVKDGMKLTRNHSPEVREPIVNRARSTSEITKDNTVKTINEYWRSYAKNKERIRQRLRDQKQRKTDKNIMCLRAWDQESEKLEMSLAPSITQCGIPTAETSSTTTTCEKP